jgi:DNA helicase-2/ATP-dependent DNA helicase PcrA
MLNPEQREAVEHPPDGAPLLILAAAGTGKTEVLTTRIARLVAECGVPPDRVLAVTFSNAAAREMRERAARLCGLPASRLAASVATFHSTAVRVLRMHPEYQEGFTILDHADALRVVREVVLDELRSGGMGGGGGMGVGGFGVAPEKDAKLVKTVYAQLNAWRNAGLEPHTVPPPASGGAAGLAYRVFPLFRERCSDARSVDFCDLLCHAVRVCGEPGFRARVRARWTHVLVDEFQDTNEVQMELVRLIVGSEGRRLTVVGDDCQTIHEHAGASVARILDFASEFAGATVVKLERNYRSTAGILDAANAVIAHNVRRMDKRLLCTRGAGDPPAVHAYRSEDAEAAGVVAAIREAVAAGRNRPRDFCVLFRINRLSLCVEQALTRAGVPYKLAGGTGFFDSAEVRDALAYLVTAVNPASRAHCVRALGVPPRGVGGKAIQRLDELAARADMGGGGGGGGGGLLAAAHAHLDAFTGKARKGLADFLDAVGFAPRSAPALHDCSEDLARAVEGVIERSGLRAHFDKRGEHERTENVEELVALGRRLAAAHFPDGGTMAELVQVLLTEGAAISTAPARRDGAAEAEAEPKEPGQGEREHEHERETGADAVTLLSMHRSKGLEWPCVHIIGYAEGIMPYEMSLREGNLEGERRLAYVALTRARDRLTLSYPMCRTWFRGYEKLEPSRFISEMGGSFARRA